MTCFLVSFHAIINGITSKQSLMGIESRSDTINPNLVVEILTKKQRTLYPSAEQITIVILEKRVVSQEEYTQEIKKIVR